MKIYTLGYQGLSAEDYVRALVNAGIGLVLDVREHAWSQRPGFVKSALQKALESSGIGYEHIRAAGNPSANRKSSHSAAQCLRRYRHHLAKKPDCLEALILLIQSAVKSGKPACLTCYERSYRECHRSVLLEELIKVEPELRPIHLEPFIAQKTRKGNHPSPVNRSQSPFGSSFVAPAFLPFM